MVLLLNGSINAGKTTVGKALCLREKWAFIEVDYLREFVSWMPIEESIDLNLENAVDVAINCDSRNIHSVIAYPLREQDYVYVSERFECSGIEAVPVTLYPGLDLLSVNRGERALTDWEVKRTKELFEQGVATPNFSHIIDNSALSVEETVDKVLEVMV
jgi:hypothetical protein